MGERRDLLRRIAGVLITAPLWCVGPNGAAGNTIPENQLRAIERAIEERRREEQALRGKAGNLAREIETIRKRIIDAAMVVQDRELGLTEIERDIVSLEGRYRKRQAAFERHRTGLEKTLAALALFARNPPSALIARPAEWADTVRGTSLLDHAIPWLKQRTDKAAAEAAALGALRTARVQLREALSNEQADLTDARDRLQSLLQRKSSLQATLVTKRRRLAAEIAAFVDEATNIRELIDRLAEVGTNVGGQSGVDDEVQGANPRANVESLGSLRPDERASAAHSPAHEQTSERAVSALPVQSSLPYPAHGELIRAFGAQLADGQSSLGLSIRTRRQAQVVAPRDGIIAFAGSFRRYGQLLIIDHGDGYHTLLSGFSRIEAEVGQSVLAGEPVGVMGTGAESLTILYVEIRHDRQPIDPIPWLTRGDRKVSG